MKFLKTALIAASLTAAPLAASATVLDFTTLDTFDSVAASGATGTLSGASYTITSDPANQLTFGQAHDGTTCVGLSCTIDGLGVSDDEITNNGVMESITITFNREVTITGLYFLDLFISEDGQSIEEANLSIDDGPTHSGFTAVEQFDGSVSGFAFFGGQSLTGTSFTFFSANTNDNIGFADYALAGLEVAPVPLPAGMLLLGGALGALGFARRRKAAA